MAERTKASPRRSRAKGAAKDGGATTPSVKKVNDDQTPNTSLEEAELEKAKAERPDNGPARAESAEHDVADGPSQETSKIPASSGCWYVTSPEGTNEWHWYAITTNGVLAGTAQQWHLAEIEAKKAARL